MKQTESRKRRLKKINIAKIEGENALLELKKGPYPYTEAAFQSLYYLLELAKKAP